jgi:toluene monooxygenase electron transfer component
VSAIQVTVESPDGEVRFETTSGRRILHAGLASGIALPYECLSGTCGSCKARLKSGEVNRLWPAAPAWSSLKADELLLCQCAAAADCTIEVKKAPGLLPQPARPRQFSGELSRWRLLCSDVVAFDIDLREPMPFEAGQFVALQFPGVSGARCYSMVNSPSSSARLEFVVKRKPAGAASNWLFEGDRGGTSISGFGPVGSATYDPELPHDLLCIAGGSGIAGIMSILLHASESRHFERHKGQVFFGLRRARDAFLLEELDGLARICGPALSMTVSFSDDAPSPALVGAYPFLRFRSGLVHESASAATGLPPGRVSAYVAGPPQAVTAALRVLLQLKVHPAAIKYDKFG